MSRHRIGPIAPGKRTEPPLPSPPAILPGLQALRAVAALMVVLHHAELNLLTGFHISAPQRLHVGAAGVDVFFVISGFIMLVSSRRLFGASAGTATFVRRRLIRIVPLYWAVTTVYVVAALALPGGLGRPVSTGTIVASYLFWPYPNVEGTLHPIAVVGWTLNFEMFFYALFGLAVALPRGRAVLAVVGGLAAAVAAGALLRPASPALAFWSSPIALEFAAGILLGAVYESGWRLPRTVALGMGLAAAAAFLIQVGQPLPDAWLRLVAYGCPALALVASAALARDGGGAWLRPLGALGDASYSLYLTHLLALWAIRVGGQKLGLAPAGPLDGALFILVQCAAAIGAAHLSYKLFERPVTDWLRARIETAPHRGGADVVAGPARGA